jgi:hypothetical protein
VFTLAQDINNGLGVDGYSATSIGEFGDLNGDGFTDLLLVGEKTKVYPNDGTGTFVDNGLVSTESAPYAGDIGDVDGDGDNDIIVGA